MLEVDLTARKISVRELSDDLIRTYVGGSSLAARFVYDETDEKTEPLSPDNPLIFSVGPLTGTKVPTSSRFSVASISPLTGIWAECDAGGSWGPALKRAGYDAILIRGISECPVYLQVTDEDSLIRECKDIWGADTYETEQILKERHGGKAEVACIGPSGENLVLYASVMTGGKHARAAGRAGLGTVMGQKRLKAIVVGGSRGVSVYDPDALTKSIRSVVGTIVEKNKRRKEYGTAGGVIGAATIGDLPTKNWSQPSSPEQAEALSGELMNQTILTGRYHCSGCPVGCGRNVKVSNGKYLVDAAGPEYEALAGFGANCLLYDLEAVSWLNDKCNRLGIDVISTSACLAFAMEAFETGLVTQADTDGLEITWGDPATMAELIERIARREGVGDLLSQGVRRMSEQMGITSSRFALHVKGLELPYHDPRAMTSLAVAYATHPRGACHRGCSHDLERSVIPDFGYEAPLDRHAIDGKAVATAKMQDYSAMYNALKLCNFISSAVGVKVIVEWLNYVTGWDIDDLDFIRTGERATNLKRLINVRRGVTRKDDVLPERILKEVFQKGGAKGVSIPLNDMLDEYYKFRGWDMNGLPLSSTLYKLGLSDGSHV